MPKESERRHATVLFADISGFTAMSERLDPEDVTHVMNRCFAALSTVVAAHGGHVDKYIGDCVMALFGVPAALEDAPQHAINAAIEMRNRLILLNQEERLPAKLDMHTGVNTGLVIAGQVGGDVKQEFTVMGDAVNLASRLKDLAPNGSIWIGPETYRYTREEFEFKKLPPLAVKGKERPVDAYEILSRKERKHRLKPVGAERMISSALVGRDAELALLRACFAAVARGEGGIINLIGEAGLGKSRLLAEACASAEAREALVLEGRSLSIGQDLSFHPFVDLLRHWTGILEDDGEQASRGKLEEAVAALFADDSGEIFPFVATLMGMRLSGAHAARVEGIGGESMEKLIQKTMRELLRRLADSRPLVLVFEDLHWADLSSIQLLESLLRLVTDARILFVHAFRPDHQETAQRILQSAREHHGRQQIEVHLDPLGERECGAFIRNLLKSQDVPYAALARIARTGEGNPFYIEEVVRSLIDEGAIEQARGGLKITEKLDSVVIPGTIQGVIMARVDRLAEPTRHLLQVASVLGRSFYYRILAQIMPAGADLDAELAYLKERQLLLEHRTRRTSTVRRSTLVEELEYVFGHALVQETIYESILQKTRKELHGRVAQAIETTFADRLPDFYGMLAYHFSRAQEVAKAEEYLFKAGDEAARAAASSEALNHFREASRLYFLMHGEGGDPGKKSLLERNIGLALMNKGNLLESIEHFDRALEFLGERIPSTRFAVTRRFALDLVVLLSRLYLNRVSGAARDGDRERFENRYCRARALTTSDPRRFAFESITTLRRLTETDPHGIDQATGMYTAGAAVFAWSGLSFAIGKRFLGIARTLVREGNAPDEFGYRSWKFVLHYLEGDWSEEHAVRDELVDQALRYGLFWDVNTYLGLNCERHIHKGQFGEARRELDRITDLANGYGYDFARSNEYAMPALLLLEQRKLPLALAAVERYHADRHEELLKLFALGIRAKIQVLAGDRDAASATLARAEELRRRLGQVPGFYLSMLHMSRFLFDVVTVEESSGAGARRPEQALVRRAHRSARQAIRISATVAREKSEAYRLAGRLRWLSGKRARALEWWERSIAAAKRMGAQPELARTYQEAGRRLVAAGEACRPVGGMPAAQLVDEAGRLFDQLGIAPDLEETRATEAAGRKGTIGGPSVAESA